MASYQGRLEFVEDRCEAASMCVFKAHPLPRLSMTVKRQPRHCWPDAYHRLLRRILRTTIAGISAAAAVAGRCRVFKLDELWHFEKPLFTQSFRRLRVSDFKPYSCSSSRCASGLIACCSEQIVEVVPFVALPWELCTVVLPSAEGRHVDGVRFVHLQIVAFCLHKVLFRYPLPHCFCIPQ